MRILVVEDEKRLAEALGQIMRENGYTSDVVFDGESGFDNALSGIYDVIILDVMLPKMNGFDVVRQLRKNKVSTPVILLTARDEVGDKVTGLDCGADDYLTKPFLPDELLARIRALSRRKGEVLLDQLAYGDLKLDLSNHILECGYRSVRLGMKEFEIMRLLMAYPGKMVSKETLLVKVWGMESEAEDNNVEVYISFLRKKLFFLKTNVEISTVRKLGYHLEEIKK
ncbi:MAG: response regulator transcription factor [Christensenellales bacterium]